MSLWPRKTIEHHKYARSLMERNLSYQKLRMELIILQCTLRAYIFDDVEKSLKRRARDENGKNTVIDNMPYSEWASKNVQEDVLANFSPYQSGTINVKNSAKITNRVEAEQLIKDIGFGSVEKNIDQIDEKLLIENVEQLKLLNDKFGILDSNNTGCFSSNNNKNQHTRAYVELSLFNEKQTLSLCQSFYCDRDYLICSIRKSVENGWSTMCLEKNYPVYSITHEYGHILEYKIFKDRININSLKTKINQQSNKQQIEKYIKIVKDEEAKKIYYEIIKTAKDNGLKVLPSVLSNYGKTNYIEAFAEIFANSQLGSPNSLGKAMNIWLERSGYVV